MLTKKAFSLLIITSLSFNVFSASPAQETSSTHARKNNHRGTKRPREDDELEYEQHPSVSPISWDTTNPEPELVGFLSVKPLSPENKKALHHSDGPMVLQNANSTSTEVFNPFLLQYDAAVKNDITGAEYDICHAEFSEEAGMKPLVTELMVQIRLAQIAILNKKKRTLKKTLRTIISLLEEAPREEKTKARFCAHFFGEKERRDQLLREAKRPAAHPLELLIPYTCTFSSPEMDPKGAHSLLFNAPNKYPRVFDLFYRQLWSLED